MRFMDVMRDERGFLHKKILGLGSSLLRTGLRFAGAAGIPVVSGAARLASSVLPGGARNTQFVSARSAQLSRGQASRRFIAQPQRVPPGLPQSNQMRFNPAVQNVIGAANSANAQAALAQTGECPRGFHKNKSTYRLVTSGELVPEGSKCVRNRRRNPDNGRASIRAARRLLARQKHAKSIDDALRSLAPRKSSRRSSPPARAGGQVIVAGN